MNCAGDTKARFGMKYLKEHWALGVVLKERPVEAVQCIHSIASEIALPGFNTASSSLWVWENFLTSPNLGLLLYGTEPLSFMICMCLDPAVEQCRV